MGRGEGGGAPKKIEFNNWGGKGFQFVKTRRNGRAKNCWVLTVIALIIVRSTQTFERERQGRTFLPETGARVERGERNGKAGGSVVPGKSSAY